MKTIEAQTQRPRETRARRRTWASRGALLAGIVALGAFSVVAFSAGHARQTAAVRSPHDGPLPYSKQQFNRILRATQTAAGDPTADLVAEGQALFNSADIAKPGQSCATCHVSGGSSGVAGIIQHPTKPGDFTGPRTAPALWNIADTAPYGWNGATPTLRAFAVRVIGLFFKDAATQPADVTAHQAAALEAFMNTIKPPRTAFDTGQLSPDARSGQQVFMEKCAVCHTPPLFVDHRVHNIGVPIMPGTTDPGSALPGVAPGALTVGGFDTPQLRGISNAAPYMHNGAFKSLEQVIDFYHGKSRIEGLRIGGRERRELLAFLQSL
jgi:cytochrome c peroxidase